MHFSTPFTYKVYLKPSYHYLVMKWSILAWHWSKLKQTTFLTFQTWMKVAYYETRWNSKHFTYIKHFNMMHGSWDIICLKFMGFSVNLLNLRIMLKSLDRKKTRMAESGGAGGAHPWARPSRCSGGPGCAVLELGLETRWAWSWTWRKRGQREASELLLVTEE